MSARVRHSRQTTRRPTRSRAGRHGVRRPRSNSKDIRPLVCKLPDPLPVAQAEVDLVRIYFADLIAHVLKDVP